MSNKPFIMVDGVDGSGKSTLINFWLKYFKSQHLKIFSFKKFWQNNNYYPSLTELKKYDILLSFEPTNIGIGQVIRQELINQNNSYSNLAIAQAYSLDRLILYTKIIKYFYHKKIIIQDRGLSTSICYQTINSNLKTKDIVSLPGNKLALNYPPDYLIILKIDINNAVNRLKDRLNKQDNSIFEKQNFLEKAQKKFLSTEFQKVFTNHNTKIKIFNSNLKIDIMEQEANKLIQSLT